MKLERNKSESKRYVNVTLGETDHWSIGSGINIDQQTRFAITLYRINGYNYNIVLEPNEAKRILNYLKEKLEQ